MLIDLFKKQQEAILAYFKQMDVGPCESIVEALYQCQGTIFFTGIGKSSFIAQKIAATFTSTGSKSGYISAIDALHGDLGMVSSNDILVIFSKSGATEELIKLIPFFAIKGVKIVAITCQRHSKIGQQADFELVVPCLHELCLHDLAPTTSTTIQMMIGDLLAIALMEKKGISRETFIENHPAGIIGKKMTLKVRDLMLDHSHVPLCHLKQLLQEVLPDFSDKRCGCLVVIDDQGALKGIFTDGDLRRGLQLHGYALLEKSMEEIMVETPAAIKEEALAIEALKLMEQDPHKPFTVLPVLKEQQQVIGLIKMHDIIQAGLK